jgi:hypothetical protein
VRGRRGDYISQSIEQVVEIKVGHWPKSGNGVFFIPAEGADGYALVILVAVARAVIMP